MSNGKTTLERIEALEAALASGGAAPGGDVLSKEIADMIMNNQAALNEQVLDLLERTGQLELANAALGKTLGAILNILDKKNIVSGGEVVMGIRDFEDKSSKQRIKKAVDQKELVRTDAATPISVVVCKEIFVDPSDAAKIELVSNYRDFNLADSMVSANLKKDLLGKQAGDAVSYDAQGGKQILTVLEVYNIAQTVEYEGEVPAAPASL